MSVELEKVKLCQRLGPEELEFTEQSDIKAFPSRLPEHPIFRPVFTEDYAVKIARGWNVKASGSGFVTRFDVLKPFRSDSPKTFN